MNPLIPTPDTIPVAWGYFQFLLLLTFPLHLFFMNATLGAAAIALYARFRKEAAGERLSLELAKALPILIAFTVNFGVAPLLFIQVLYGHFIYVSSILMAVFWLAVVPLLIVAYYAAYLYDFKFELLGRRGLWVLGTALAIFLTIAFIYTNNMSLMLLPKGWTSYFNSDGGTLLNLADPTLWPRYLHMAVGALAVGGLFVALFGRFKRDAELSALAQDIGLKAFAYLTLAQVLLGVWFLIALPRGVMLQFMGDLPLATALFLVALALVAAVLVAAFKAKVWATASLAVPLVVVMTFMRAYVRSGTLAEHFTLDQLQLTPQYGPMVLFFVTLVVGVVAVVWMLMKTRSAYRGGE